MEKARRSPEKVLPASARPSSTMIRPALAARETSQESFSSSTTPLTLKRAISAISATTTAISVYNQFPFPRSLICSYISSFITALSRKLLGFWQHFCVSFNLRNDLLDVRTSATFVGDVSKLFFRGYLIEKCLRCQILWLSSSSFVARISCDIVPVP